MVGDLNNHQWDKLGVVSVADQVCLTKGCSDAKVQDARVQAAVDRVRCNVGGGGKPPVNISYYCISGFLAHLATPKKTDLKPIS